LTFTARTETYVNVSSISSPYNFTLNKPSGTAEGDFLYAFFMTYKTSAVSVDSVPTDWQLIAERTVSTYYHFWLYYKVAGDSEPTSYTWSLSTTAKLHAVCGCYTGGDFDPADPIDVYSNTEYKTSDTICRAASMVVGAANSPLLFFGGVYHTSAKTFTKPTIPTSGWVEDDDVGSTTPDFWSTTCSMIWADSGATGNINATLSASDAQKHAFAVALNPAGGVTTYEKTFASDAYLEKTDTQKTLSIDGYLEKTDNTKNISADAIITLQGEKIVTADGFLKKEDSPKTLTTDAILERVDAEKTFTTDTLLEKIDNIKTLSANAILESSISEVQKPFTIDVYLQKEDTQKSVTADSYLKQFDTQKTASSDALLEKEDTPKTFSVDAYLEKQDNAKPLSTNGLLEQQDNAKTLSSDGILEATFIHPIITDGYLEKQDNPKTVSADATIILQGEKNVTTDVILKATTPKTLSADANLIRFNTQKTLTAGARLIIPGAGWNKKITGISNPSKIMGIPITDIEKIMGISP